MTPVVVHVARWLFPAVLAVAAAFLVRGYSHAGDGFVAGLLAGLAALLQVLALGRERGRRAVAARVAWPVGVVGLLIILAVALAPLAAGFPPVTHFPRPGAHVVKLGALELHTAVLYDLGTALLVYGAIVTLVEQVFESEEPAS